MYCAICKGWMKEPEWEWGEEDAHKDCVIEDSDIWCPSCGYFTKGFDMDCPYCEGEMEELTEELRKSLKEADVIARYRG